MILVIFAALVVLFVVLPIIGIALWTILTTIVVGLIIGGLGRLLVPGIQPIGFLATVAAGLCGSILGGFIGQHILHVAWFGTLLLEIGIAALFVFLFAGRSRQVGAPPRT